MRYGDLIQLYFNRSAALQWYWTLYVVIIGGILAFSTLRQRPDRIKALLITILYCCFAYKNCGAIKDTIGEQTAILTTIRQTPASTGDATADALRSQIDPTINPTDAKGAAHFHLITDALTVIAIWAMERRRRLTARDEH